MKRMAHGSAPAFGSRLPLAAGAMAAAYALLIIGMLWGDPVPVLAAPVAAQPAPASPSAPPSLSPAPIYLDLEAGIHVDALGMVQIAIGGTLENQGSVGATVDVSEDTYTLYGASGLSVSPNADTRAAQRKAGQMVDPVEVTPGAGGWGYRITGYLDPGQKARWSVQYAYDWPIVDRGDRANTGAKLLRVTAPIPLFREPADGSVILRHVFLYVDYPNGAVDIANYPAGKDEPATSPAPGDKSNWLVVKTYSPTAAALAEGSGFWLDLSDGQAVKYNSYGLPSYRYELSWNYALPAQKPEEDVRRAVVFPLSVRIALGNPSLAGLVWLLGVLLVAASLTAWHYARLAGGRYGLPQTVWRWLSRDGRLRAGVVARRGALGALALMVVSYLLAQGYWALRPPLVATGWATLRAQPQVTWRFDFVDASWAPVVIYAIDLVDLDSGARAAASLSARAQRPWEPPDQFQPVSRAVFGHGGGPTVQAVLDRPSGAELQGSEWVIHYRVLGWPRVLRVPAAPPF